MQVAWQGYEQSTGQGTERSNVDYTPSGIYPVGRARREAPAGQRDEPLIVVHELSDAEVAQLALVELESDDEWDDGPTESYERPLARTSAGEPDHTFELPPVSTAVKLTVVGEAWCDDEETTRFERGIPVLLPRSFGAPELRLADGLADELAIGAGGSRLQQRLSSPWMAASSSSLPAVELACRAAAERPWRRRLLVAAITVTVQAALLASLALALG